MATIGRFRSVHVDDPLKELSGDIRTLNFNADVLIKRVLASDHPDAPTHRVLAQSKAGDFVEVGSAWTKQTKTGPNPGDEFLSVSIDDPSFDHPLNFAVFSEGDGKWIATFRRRKKDAA